MQNDEALSFGVSLPYGYYINRYCENGRACRELVLRGKVLMSTNWSLDGSLGKTRFYDRVKKCLNV